MHHDKTGGRPGKRLGVALLLVLSLGIVLRTAQFAGQVDLWHDELAIARNVEGRGLVALLTQPLDHEQVAPVGFLALLNGMSGLLGVDEVGLRCVPWLLSLLSLLLFWRILSRFATGAPMIGALALFAASPALVWYGSSVKPYGGDVAMSLLLVLLALRHLEEPGETARGLTAGLLGGLAMLVSFPAVPTGAILGVLLLAAWWRGRRRTPALPLLSLGVGWGLGALTAGIIARSLLSAETESFMQDFWADDFPPDAGPLAALSWGLSRLREAFSHFLVFFPPDNPVLIFIVTLPLLLALIGLVVAVRRRQLECALLLAPPVAGLGAAFAHLLPFDQRLGLHAVWPVLILAALGVSALSGVPRGWPRLVPITLSVLMALPLVAIVLLVARPPYSASRGTPPREVLEALAARVEPGDRLYVFTQGRHDMAFYGRRSGINDWTQGERHYGEPTGYLREVDDLRGSDRAWFFWVRLDRDDPAWIRSYLSTIGRELEQIPDSEPGAAGAVLYDLSDPDRLGRASADSFPPPEDAAE